MKVALWIPAFAALAAAAPAPAADDPPATITLKKESVEFTVDVNGAFDARSPVEVTTGTKSWNDELEVEECFAGGPVEKDAPLVRFKTEKIDDQIRAAERDLAVAKAALAVQTEERQRQAEAAALAMAEVDRRAKDAAESLAHFEKVEMQLRLDEATHRLDGTRDWIQDQVEELAQLEKMYKEDELVEATEEIVIRRSKRGLDRSKRSLGFSLVRDQAMREMDIPRDLEQRRHASKSADQARDRLHAVSELQLAQSRLELERTKGNVETQEKNFAKLQADRQRFVVTAPEAGLAVPGALLRGKWQGAEDVGRRLRKGGKFRGTEVLFTIVRRGDVRVVGTVPEATLFQVQAGQPAQVNCAAAGETTLAAKVASVTSWSGGGEYAVALDLDAPDERLLPGFTCKVRIAAGTREALMIPSAAVEDGGFEKSVHFPGGDKPEKRAVRLGATKGDRVEVLAGLAEGDVILATPPKKK